MGSCQKMIDMQSVIRAAQSGVITTEQFQQIGRLVDSFGSSQEALQAAHMVFDMSHYEPNLIENMAVNAPMFVIALAVLITLYFGYRYTRNRVLSHKLHGADDELESIKARLDEIEQEFIIPDRLLDHEQDSQATLTHSSLAYQAESESH